MRTLKIVKNEQVVDIEYNINGYKALIDGIEYDVNVDFDAGKIEILGICEQNVNVNIDAEKLALYSEKLSMGNGTDLKPLISGTRAYYSDNDCFYSLTEDEKTSIRYLTFDYSITDNNLVEKTTKIMQLHGEKGVGKHILNLKDNGQSISSCTIDNPLKSIEISSSDANAIKASCKIYNSVADTNDMLGQYRLYAFTNEPIALDVDTLKNAKSMYFILSSFDALFDAINIFRFTDKIESCILSVQYSENSISKFYSVEINFYEEDGVLKKSLSILDRSSDYSCSQEISVRVLDAVNSVFFDNYEEILYVDENGIEKYLYSTGSLILDNKKLHSKCSSKPFDKFTSSYRDITIIKDIDIIKDCVQIINGQPTPCGYVGNTSLGNFEDIMDFVNDGVFDDANRSLSSIEIGFLIENGVTNINASNFSYQIGQSITTPKYLYDFIQEKINAPIVNFTGIVTLPCMIGDEVTDINCNEIRYQYSYSFMENVQRINGEEISTYQKLLRDKFPSGTFFNKYGVDDNLSLLFDNFINNRGIFTGRDNEILTKFATMYNIFKDTLANYYVTYDDVMDGATIYFNYSPYKEVEAFSKSGGTTTGYSETHQVSSKRWYIGVSNGSESAFFNADTYEILGSNVIFKTDGTIFNSEILNKATFTTNGYVLDKPIDNSAKVIRQGFVDMRTDFKEYYVDEYGRETIGRTIGYIEKRIPDDEVTITSKEYQFAPQRKSVDYTITKLDDGSIDIEWVNNSDIDAKFFTINNKKLYLEGV